MNRIKLAVIADDFTGGADAASFLKRKHANVVLLTGIPLMLPDCDCVVFALKYAVFLYLMQSRKFMMSCCF